MFQLTHLHYATIIIDVCAVFLVFGILRQTRFMRRAGRESDRLFLRLLIIPSRGLWDRREAAPAAHPKVIRGPVRSLKTESGKP